MHIWDAQEGIHVTPSAPHAQPLADEVSKPVGGTPHAAIARRLPEPLDLRLPAREHDVAAAIGALYDAHILQPLQAEPSGYGIVRAADEKQDTTVRDSVRGARQEHTGGNRADDRTDDPEAQQTGTNRGEAVTEHVQIDHETSPQPDTGGETRPCSPPHHRLGGRKS